MKFKFEKISNINQFPFSKTNIYEQLEEMGIKVYKEDDGINDKLNQVIPLFLEELTKSIDSNILPDWTLTLRALFTRGDSINIYKRGFTYPSDKQKEITIQIPIPSNEQISWGIEEERFIDRGAIDYSKFTIIPIDYKLFDNLADFIIACVKIGIERRLKDGVTLKGMKIKI